MRRFQNDDGPYGRNVAGQGTPLCIVEAVVAAGVEAGAGVGPEAGAPPPWLVRESTGGTAAPPPPPHPPSSSASPRLAPSIMLR